MEQNKSAKEFIENIYSLNLLNSKLESEDKKLILTLKVKGESIDNIICEFKILEREKIWIKIFKFEDFKEYSNKMGFDGSWKSFFKSMELAVNRIEGGDMCIKFQLCDKQAGKKPPIGKRKEIEKLEKMEKIQNLNLTMFHPLSEDLKVKSEILFEQFYNNDSEEYRNFNFDIALELHESFEYKLNREKAQEKMKIFPNSNIQNGLPKSLYNESVNSENRSVSKLELKKNVKRKFNSDLINPNIKKRRGKGVRFVEDNDFSEQTNEDNQ